jgi:hypothetical protein
MLHGETGENNPVAQDLKPPYAMIRALLRCVATPLFRRVDRTPFRFSIQTSPQRRKDASTQKLKGKAKEGNLV